LRIGDDHDLVCRTYLAGVRFAHVKQPLYLYRVSSGIDRNTSTREVESLAAARAALTEKYTYPLVDRWCVERDLLRVDLGALHGKPDGFVGVDLAAGPGVDVVCDVRDGLPFATDAVGRLRAHDFLEHLAPGAPIINLWNEIYRVLAPGGWFTSLTPSTVGLGAFCAPDHCSYWNRLSHRYVTDRAAQSYVRGLTARFQATRIQEFFPSAWHQEQNIAYLRMDLVALKGQRQPGPIGF
jgi:SAM-dependent methyltransferase